MKFLSLVFAIAFFFANPTEALEKTQQEAHKFLIDNGQVTADSVVQSFTLDRTGNVRVRVSEGDFVYSFGLEQSQDTYSIGFMSKKKQVAATKKTGTASGNDELAKKIGESISLLKGGKVVKVHEQPSAQGHGKKTDTIVQYKVGTKTYTVTGRLNQKTGQFNVRKVEDGAPKLAQEL